MSHLYHQDLMINKAHAIQKLVEPSRQYWVQGRQNAGPLNARLTAFHLPGHTHGTIILHRFFSAADTIALCFSLAIASLRSAWRSLLFHHTL